MGNLNLPSLTELFLGAPGTPSDKKGGGIGNLDNINGNPVVGTGQGNVSYKYQYSEIGENPEDKEENLDILPEDEEAIDLISKKVNLGPRSRIDLGHGSPHNADYMGSVPVNGLAENHTNMVRPGISPYSSRISPKTVSSVQAHIGLTVRHGVQKTGDLYGPARPHFDQTEVGEHDLTYEFDINAISGDKDDLMSRSFNKQQNKIKNILNEINSFFYDI